MLPWTVLRKLPENKFISSMYIWLFLVPIPAKLFAKLNDVVTLTIFGTSIELNLSLPFSWKILFFCSLIFVLANILYSLTCPKLIKDHPNYSHFRDEGKGIEQLVNYLESMKLSDIRETSDDERTQSEILEAWFWRGVENVNTSYNELARFLCTTFYGLGIVLLLWLVYENIRWVVQVTFL